MAKSPLTSSLQDRWVVSKQAREQCPGWYCPKAGREY